MIKWAIIFLLVSIVAGFLGFGGVASGARTVAKVLFFIGIAIGQLVWGPLADRYGRRPMLLAGMGGYTLASVLAAASPTIEWLVAARALQGAAMAATVTCGRSIVRDLYEPGEVARAA